MLEAVGIKERLRITTDCPKQQNEVKVSKGHAPVAAYADTNQPLGLNRIFLIL